MIAKVMHNNSVYYSPVFAVSMKRNNCKGVIFDSSSSELIVVTIFQGNNYNILFMDYNTENFSINEDKLKSYWNDRAIFKTIRRKKYTSKMLEEAQTVLTRMKPQEYTKVTSKSTLEALEFNTGSFHDGYILAMQEKEDTLEILFDTSWGSLVILKCKGIIENTLDIGYVFFHCEMDIDKDGAITFTANPMGHCKESIYKAQEVQFKPLFEKRIPLRRFNYTVDNKELTLECDNQTIRISKVNNDIFDFGKRNVLGYLQNDGLMQRCFIFSKDIVYSFHRYIETNKKANSKVAKFKEECENQGFAFDVYPLDDFFEEYEYDYGKLIYSQNYSNFQQLIYIFKILIPILMVYNIFALIIQLLNPQMKWTFYWIFGLGIPMILLLIYLIFHLVSMLRNKISGNSDQRIEIYENGLQYRGYNIGFNVAYEYVSRVEYTNKIIVYTSIGKFTIHKSKNDKYIFDLINDRVSKLNQNHDL